MRIKIIAFIILPLLVFTVNAQTENQKLFKQALDSSSVKAYHYSIPIYKELIKREYREQENYEFLISTYLINDSLQNGIKYATKAHKKFPDNVIFLKYAANLYAKAGDAKNVIIHLEKAIVLEPNNDLLYTFLGNFYADTRQYDNALLNYSKATKLNPKSFFANYGKGSIYVNQAVAIKKKMNNLEFNDSQYDLYKKQEAALNKNAIAALEKALEVKPNDTATLSGLVQLYISTDNIEKYKATKTKLKEVRGY